jgi:hypothetical protein
LLRGYLVSLLVDQKLWCAVRDIAHRHTADVFFVLDDLRSFFLTSFLLLRFLENLHKGLVCEHVALPDLLKQLFRDLATNLEPFTELSFYHLKPFNPLDQVLIELSRPCKHVLFILFLNRPCFGRKDLAEFRLQYSSCRQRFLVLFLAGNLGATLVLQKSSEDVCDVLDDAAAFEKALLVLLRVESRVAHLP